MPAPDRVGENIARDRPIGVQEQKAQHRNLPRTAGSQSAAVAPSFDRPENPKAAHLTRPRWIRIRGRVHHSLARDSVSHLISSPIDESGSRDERRRQGPAVHRPEGLRLLPPGGLGNGR